uniref:tRNA lysidine(34) synthetase TilS n=1 Tax=Marinobacterium profundum TaxID=1714300 RepID=UPI0008305079|nr:tRNA lysidine(34) synthetase TilS [Marinobacterium profundum]
MPADELLQAFARQLAEQHHVRRWLIAYSGGLDSRVLVELAARVLDPSRILLLHVNHKLQAESDAWAAHCVAQARALGLAIQVLEVAPASASEADARDARYDAFIRQLRPGDLLLQGHHSDDQAETLLLRLMRGAGPKGLAGMPRQRALGEAQLLRPLLDVRRAELERWAREQRLSWVEDPSNSAVDYDRNFIRHRVMAPLIERWPGVQTRMGLSAGLLDESVGLLEELARDDLAACWGSQGGLTGKALSVLSPPRQRNLLRHWLAVSSGVTINGSLLARIEQEVLQAGPDRQPELSVGSYKLRRYRGDLFLLAQSQAASAEKLAQIRLVPGDMALPHGRLSIVTARADESVIPAHQTSVLRTLAGLALRYRREGERCRPLGRSGSHPLKKLFQEYQVLPWLRDTWPLLVCDDEIVAVPGLWVCDGWQAEAGDEGYSADWHPA